MLLHGLLLAGAGFAPLESNGDASKCPAVNPHSHPGNTARLTEGERDAIKRSIGGDEVLLGANTPGAGSSQSAAGSLGLGRLSGLIGRWQGSFGVNFVSVPTAGPDLSKTGQKVLVPKNAGSVQSGDAFGAQNYTETIIFCPIPAETLNRGFKGDPHQARNGVEETGIPHKPTSLAPLVWPHRVLCAHR